MFDLLRWKPVGTLAAGEKCVTELTLTDDGDTLVTAGQDGAVRVWDTVALKLKGSFTPMPGACVHGIDVTPDGGRVAVVAYNCHAVHRDRVGSADRMKEWAFAPPTDDPAGPKRWQEVDSWQEGSGKTFQKVRYLPDGRLVHADWNGNVIAWKGDAKQTVGGNAPGALRFAPSPDGRWVLMAGADGLARWAATDPGVKARVVPLKTDIARPSAAAVHPDGRLAVVAGDGLVRVLRLPDR